MPKQYYYAVKEGVETGVFYSWNECKDKVLGYNGAVYKKFTKKEDAQKFIDGEFDESDLKITDTEAANLSVGNIELIDYIKKDKSLLNLNNISKYKDGNYYIFTDGSRRKDDLNQNQNKNKTQYQKKMISGFGIYFGMNQINISQVYQDKTNNYCELISIKYVLEVLDCYKKEIKQIQKEKPNITFYIVSDSEYCINSIDLWMDIWQRNGWKTKTNKIVEHQDLFLEIYLYKSKLKLHKINFKLKHVNSHQPPPLSNDYEMFIWKGNQFADYLATYTK